MFVVIAATMLGTLSRCVRMPCHYMQSAKPVSRLSAALPFLFVFLWSTGFIGAKFGLPFAEPLTFLLSSACPTPNR